MPVTHGDRYLIKTSKQRISVGSRLNFFIPRQCLSLQDALLLSLGSFTSVRYLWHREAGKVVWVQHLVWERRGFNDTNAGHFVPVVLLTGKLQPRYPFSEPWSGHESSRSTTAIWLQELVVGIEAGAGTKAKLTSKRQERGWSWTKRICWGLCQGAPGAAIWLQAVPGTTSLRCSCHHTGSFFSTAQQWPCWGGSLLNFPTLCSCSAASARCRERAGGSWEP